MEEPITLCIKAGRPPPIVFKSDNSQSYVSVGLPGELANAYLLTTGNFKTIRSGRRRIETHVNCSQCGSDTTVPFKPTQGRPVLCATCFSHRAKVLESPIPQRESIG